MAFIRIHCDNCGGSWEIYHRDNWNKDEARQCPHCYEEIDRQIWKKEIIPAFAAVEDANGELYKDSTGCRRPLFTVDFIADTYHRPKKEENAITCPLLEEMQNIGEF